MSQPPVPFFASAIALSGIGLLLRMLVLAVLEDALRRSVLVEAHAIVGTAAATNRRGGAAAVEPTVVGELRRMRAEDHRAQRDAEAA